MRQAVRQSLLDGIGDGASRNGTPFLLCHPCDRRRATLRISTAHALSPPSVGARATDTTTDEGFLHGVATSTGPVGHRSRHRPSRAPVPGFRRLYGHLRSRALGRRSLDSLPLPGRRRDRRRPHSHRAWPIARRDRRPLLRVARRGSHGSPLRPMRSATAVRCGAEFLVGSAMTLPSSALAACISSPIASAVRSFIPSSTPA